MKNIVKSILIVLLGLIILVGCTQVDQQNQSSEDMLRTELVLAIGGEPEDGFDPTTGWGRYGSPLFQSTLFTLDKDLNVVNDLATDYEIINNGLDWIVSIRDDVHFSDGERLTAKDIVFTYKTAKNSGSIVDLHNLKDVVEIDPYTIKFTLEKPQSTFIYILIATGIVPEHAYSETYRENPIGTGPYQFVQWDKGQQLIVEKNPYYYGKKPLFEKLTFLFLSEDAAFAAAKAGEVDVVSVTPLFAKESIQGMKRIALESVDNRGIMFPYVKSGKQMPDGTPIGHDVTSDLAIRKAINIAIDRNALVDGVLEGFGTPAYTIADHLPWWNPDTIIEDGDMEKAITILENAGWQENEEGIREKASVQAAFTLLYPADDQLRQSLSMAFADMIKPLGIHVTTEGKSWNELTKLMHSNPVMMGWGSHDPLEMYNVYHSSVSGQGHNNPNFYSNSIVDDYMDQALRETSEEKANQLWKNAQWDGKTGFSALGDAPWAWLVNLQHLYFVRENLEIGDQKIQPHGHGWPITDFITDWYWVDEVTRET